MNTVTSGSRALAVLLILLTGVLFFVRGPIRFSQHPADEPTDLLGPFLGSKAWVRGLNPYTPDVHWQLKAEAGWEVTERDRHDGFASRTAYPITAFVLLSPFTPMSWTPARLVTIGFVSVLVLLTIGALASTPILRNRPLQRILFIASALALAPLQTSIGAGNLAAPAVAFIAIATWATLTNKPSLAGIALAFGICLKPPIGLPLLAYYILRRWRSALIAIATVAVIGGIGVLRLYVAGVPWLADYLQNNQLLVGGQGGAMIQHSGSQRQFINLQYLGYQLFGDAQTASVVAVIVGGILLLVWLLSFAREGHRSELLAISSLAVISLLPIYHRVYDAALLLLPLCWIFADSLPRTKAVRVMTWLLMLAFFIPGTTFLEMQAGRIPAWLSARWWWNSVVLTHQVWALLGIAVALLAAQALTRRAQPAMS